MSADVTNLVEDYLSVVQSKDNEIFRLVEENRRLTTRLGQLQSHMENSSANVESWKQQCDASVGQMQHEAKRADGAERLLSILRPFASHVASLLSCELDWNEPITTIEEQTLAVTQFLQKTVSEIKKISPKVKHQSHVLEDVLETSLASAQFYESEARNEILASSQDIYNAMKLQEKAHYERVAAIESQRATYCYVAEFAAEGVQDSDGLYNHALSEHAEVSTVHSTISGDSRPYQTHMFGSVANSRHVAGDRAGSTGSTSSSNAMPPRSSGNRHHTISFEESAAAAFGQLSKLKSERNTAVSDALSLRAEGTKVQQQNLKLVKELTFYTNSLDRVAQHALLRIKNYQDVLLAQREDFLEYRVLWKMFEKLTEIDVKNVELNQQNKYMKERMREQHDAHKRRVHELEVALDHVQRTSGQEISEQKTLINDLRGKIADSIRREANLKRNLKMADAEYRAEIEDARNQTMQLNESMTFAEENNRSATKALERSQLAAVQFEKKTQQLEEHKGVLQQTLQECEAALSAAQEENATLRVAKAKDEHSFLDQATNYEREITTSSAKVQQLEQELSKCKSEASTNTAQYTSTLSQLKDYHHQELNQVRNKIEELLASQAAAQQHWANEYDSKVGDLQEANTAQSELITKLKQQLAAANEAVTTINEKHGIEIRLLKALIAKSEGDAQRAVQELETLHRTDNTLRENEELRHKVSELEMACEISVKQIAELREALHMSVERQHGGGSASTRQFTPNGSSVGKQQQHVQGMAPSVSPIKYASSPSRSERRTNYLHGSPPPAVHQQQQHSTGLPPMTIPSATTTAEMVPSPAVAAGAPGVAVSPQRPHQEQGHYHQQQHYGDPFITLHRPANGKYVAQDVDTFQISSVSAVSSATTV